MNKRGQFFLLAAVIISAVIISLGIGTNKVTVSEEPDDFYDFGYEVKREVGAVLDYAVYSGFSDASNLEDFVDLLALDIEERSPGSDFIIIYGNVDGVQLRNYGSDSVYFDGIEVEGMTASADSRICLGRTCQSIDDTMIDFSRGGTDALLITDLSRDDNVVSIQINGADYHFPLSEYRQVIFIMQKDVGGDRHIIIE